jgi:transcriptional regulator of acetoin/glycerol metabolism
VDGGAAAGREFMIPSQRERTLVALRSTEGKVTGAARILHVTPTTVWRRIRHFGIDLREIREARRGA